MRPSGLACGAISLRRDLYFKIPGQYRDHEAEAYERGWYWGKDNHGNVAAVIPFEDMQNKHFMLGYRDYQYLAARVDGDQEPVPSSMDYGGGPFDIHGNEGPNDFDPTSGVVKE